MPAGQLTVPVPFDVADELDTLHEYLDDRLIGRVPAALTALLQAVARAETRTLVYQLVDDEGQPLGTGDRAPVSAEEDARIEEEVAAFHAWEDSPEGRAEIAEGERFHEFMEANGEAMEAEYRTWLDTYVEEFDRARSAWWRARRAQLRTEFDAQTAN